MFSPLESFDMYNNAVFFGMLNKDVFIFFMLMVLLFLLLFSNMNHMLKNFNLFYNLKMAFNALFELFKTLMVSSSLLSFVNMMFITVIFVFLSNMAGFFLTEMSLTSHASVTLFLSFFLFFSFFLTSMMGNGYSFYNQFYMKNLNMPLTVALFFMELISYLVSPFSLGISLFANILSGHMLIHMFFGAFMLLYKLVMWLSIILFLIVLFMMTMELFVSCVQSYIFLMLSLMYLQDVMLKH